MLTEAVSSQTRGRATNKKSGKAKSVTQLLTGLEKHILLDGFRVIVDLKKSRGSYLYDAASNRPSFSSCRRRDVAGRGLGKRRESHTSPEEMLYFTT